MMSHSATILIVDDIAANRETLIRILEHEDYNLVEAANGHQALEIATQLLPDLILLDVMMPQIDGFEVCRRLRSNPQMREIPVIMVTANDDQEARLMGLESGADDFIIKPFNSRELRARVRTVTRLNRYARLCRERAKAAEATARVQEQAALIELATDAIVVLEPHGTVRFWNRGAEKIFGTSATEAIGKCFSDVTGVNPTPPFKDALGQTLAQGEWQGEFQARVQSRDHLILHSRWTLLRHSDGTPKGILTVSTDQTEFRKMQALFHRTQRMESLGALASGIAHDLNNALAPILMVTTILRMQYPDAAGMIDTVESSAKRSADMVKQLLTFAKGAEGDRVLIHPKRLFQELEKIVRSTFPKNIALRTQYAQDLPPVEGDPTQLHQVLLNLSVNARDAMPHGGTLRFETEHAEVTHPQANTVPEAKPGQYVVLRVKDTGAGIPPAVLERIFEPFFTTKSPDKGTGLGLSTVVGIVKGHRGFIQVQSMPNHGTTFAVYLPAANLVPEPNDTAMNPVRTSPAFRGRGEMILVVDDEPAVRQAARAVLKSLNFQVITASDGTDALIQVGEHRDALRLIIVDAHMPHMDGLTFVRTIHRMLPNIGVVLSSGQFDEQQENEFHALGINSRLTKPFTHEELAEAVRKTLEATRTAN